MKAYLFTLLVLQIKFAVAAAIGLKTLGGIFFILGSSLGAILLVSNSGAFILQLSRVILTETYSVLCLVFFVAFAPGNFHTNLI